jgi:hypothetical protein
MAGNDKQIWLDRTVVRELVEALKPGRPLRPLVDLRSSRQSTMDQQFRRPSGRISRLSVYAGLTRILDVDVRVRATQDPEYRFFIEHQTHRQATSHHDAWSAWQSLAALSRHWPAVRSYLDERERWFETAPNAAHHVIEGRVHAAMCSDGVASYRVINREASPSFRNQQTKEAICGRIRAEMR